MRNLLLFIGAAIIIILISILWFLYSRQQKQRKEIELTQLKLKEANKRVEVEKQKRTAELKAVRSQLNPHFIFNLLNSIQEFVILGEKQEVNKALTNVASLIRKTLQHSEQETISLKDELSLVKLYLDAEKMRFEDRLNYEIILDEEVEDEFIQIPPMLIQPYVENCVKHGLMHKKEAGEIKISALMTENDELKIIITDNGVGRDKALQFKKDNPENHNSFSTKANQERLENIAKDTGLQANVQIIDLFEGSQSAGTQVIIIFAT